MNLKDVQKLVDYRGISIDRVGVNNVRFPFTLPMRDGPAFNTIADISMMINLNKDTRGTHMSRFMEILNGNDDWFDPTRIYGILADMITKLEAKQSYLRLNFPIFIPKVAPVSKAMGLQEYNCEYYAMLCDDGYTENTISVSVNVNSLCPCSKEIAEYGAHNQRSKVFLKVQSFPRSLYEDLIDLIEKCGSSQLYPILKREDEKWVTEQAYKNPKFVEDILRDIVIEVEKIPGIKYYFISVNNEESIHNHDAYAQIEKGKLLYL